MTDRPHFANHEHAATTTHHGYTYLMFRVGGGSGAPLVHVTPYHVHVGGQPK